MRRKTIDLLASIAGLVAAVVLLVAGIYFSERASFAHDNVRQQLRDQRISFPAIEDLTEAERAQPGLVKYAGQPVDDGDKAEVYANEFIGLHLSQIAGGKTYSEISAESQANPEDAALKGKVETAFKGETLRGLLLTTFAFWTLGQEAQLMTWVAFIGAAVLFLLSLAGFWHSLRTKPTELVV